MENLLYHVISAGFQACIWGGELIGEENLPKEGPAIFVSNHLGALGPIAVVASVPRRLYPWVVSAMLDASLAPDYLRRDFVEKELSLPMPFSLWLAKAISKISVPLLTYLGCIPVYPDAEGLHATFERSVDLLVQNRFILVLPEDPNRPLDPQTRMSPFRKGFVRLGELYFQRTGRLLWFYPIAAHAESRCVQVGRPIAYNPYAPSVQERLRVKNILEKMIHEMYLGMHGAGYIGVPLPH
jgi:hypothetical protein